MTKVQQILNLDLVKNSPYLNPWVDFYPMFQLLHSHWGDHIDVITLRGHQNVSEARDDMGTYSQTSNISLTLVGNKIVHHSDVVGASPAGAAPTTSSFST